MMHTECTTEQLVFQGFSKAPVVADFNGGSITSDAGADEPTEPLAGKSTLQRAETPGERRYLRVDVDQQTVGDFFVDTYLDSLKETPREIILDLDATDDRLHGQQEGRFSTATTTATATCRCTSLPAMRLCARNSGAATSTPLP